MSTHVLFAIRRAADRARTDPVKLAKKIYITRFFSAAVMITSEVENEGWRPPMLGQ